MKALALCALVACTHAPQVTAKADSASVAGAQEGAGAQSEAQAGSTAGVAVSTGRRHVGVRIIPALDGGMPTIGLDVDDDPTIVSAGATGEADAGAEGAADAGVLAAGAGNAGAGASSPPGFWSFGKLIALAGLGALIAGCIVLWKIKPPWLGWLWKLLGH